MSVKVKIAPNRAATAITGMVSGMVISNIRRQKPAPSTSARCGMPEPGRTGHGIDIRLAFQQIPIE